VSGVWEADKAPTAHESVLPCLALPRQQLLPRLQAALRLLLLLRP
jgi:hypothetical protein